MKADTLASNSQW